MEGGSTGPPRDPFRRRVMRGSGALGVTTGRKPGATSELFSEARGLDVELVAVLGDGAAGDVDAALFELFDEGLVAEGLGLVFLVDDFFEGDFDGVPGDVLA